MKLGDVSGRAQIEALRIEMDRYAVGAPDSSREFDRIMERHRALGSQQRARQRARARRDVALLLFAIGIVFAGVYATLLRAVKP